MNGELVGVIGGCVSRCATTGKFFAVERRPDISVNKRFLLRIQRLLDFEGGEIITQIRYDRDIVAWTHKQALLLRSGQLSAIDAEHLAEEIEAVSASERRELRDQPFVCRNRPAPLRFASATATTLPHPLRVVAVQSAQHRTGAQIAHGNLRRHCPRRYRRVMG